MLVQGGLKVDDLFEQAKSYLSDATLLVFSQPARTQLIYVYPDKPAEICAYYGIKVKGSEIENGIKIMATRLNNLAANGSIKGYLAKMIGFNLSPSPETTGYFNEDGTPKELEYVILSYVHLTEDVYNNEMKNVSKEVGWESVIGLTI